ncbi:hypothetical protein C8R47DRAFT_69032 [Mycena vitilis]|nr:hypothetical protein C8R47DRAFT_69032 [Mycena vitilis]
MPIFNNCAGFHVHNGTFCEVRGDMNLQMAQDHTLRFRLHDREREDATTAANARPLIPRRERSSGETGTRNEAFGARLSRLLRSFTQPSPNLADSRFLRRGSSTAPQPRLMPTMPMSSTDELVSDSAVGGTYIAAENVNHVHRHSESGIHILHRSVAHEAIFDSAESFPQPRCHPETRVDMLAGLLEWATKPEQAVSVLWLHGPAGAGKSAVMQTLCQQLQDAGRLGGSFFFRRGHRTRGNGTAFFATLAYQLHS